MRIVATISWDAGVLVVVAAVLLAITGLKFIVRDATGLIQELKSFVRMIFGRRHSGKPKKARPILRGVPVSAGQVVARLYFDFERAAKEKNGTTARVAIVCNAHQPYDLAVAFADALVF